MLKIIPAGEVRRTAAGSQGIVYLGRAGQPEHHKVFHEQNVLGPSVHLRPVILYPHDFWQAVHAVRLQPRDGRYFGAAQLLLQGPALISARGGRCTAWRYAAGIRLCRSKRRFLRS